MNSFGLRLHENVCRQAIVYLDSGMNGVKSISPTTRWCGRLVPRRRTAQRSGATRSRAIECIYRWLIYLEITRHVPAGPYVGVLPLR